MRWKIRRLADCYVASGDVTLASELVIQRAIIVALSVAALAAWVRYSCALILCAGPSGLARPIERLMRHAGAYPRAVLLLRREFDRRRGERCPTCGGFTERGSAERLILTLNFQYLRLRCRVMRSGGRSVDEMASIVSRFGGRGVNYRRY